MPRNRKILSHNSVVLITSRTEEGLPLVPNRLINTIIWSILSRARSLYRIKICHFVFMANHMHVMAVIDDPEHLPLFMRYLKTESAHAINRLLGREKKTIWADGYDSPVVISAEDVFRYINYIYSNPQKASLVETLDEYPGVSSWEMFLKDEHTKECPKIRRDTIEALTEGKHTQTVIDNAVNSMLKENTGSSHFILEPYAFLPCFEETKRLTKSAAKDLIIKELRRTETYLSRNRKTQVVGAAALLRQDMRSSYIPNKRGKRMICISSDKEQRRRYIDWFKQVSVLALEAYRSLQRGVFQMFPAGAFLPGKCMSANLNPCFMFY